MKELIEFRPISERKAFHSMRYYDVLCHLYPELDQLIDVYAESFWDTLNISSQVLELEFYSDRREVDNREEDDDVVNIMIAHMMVEMLDKWTTDKEYYEVKCSFERL